MNRYFSNRLFLLLLSIALISSCQRNNKNKVEEETEEPSVMQQSGSQGLYELRTYYAAEGKLENLLARFRDHTVTLFKKHGMENIAYWTPVENNDNLLIYILRFPDEEARTASWQAFREDPDWIAAKEASEVDGKLVDSLKSQLMNLTDFSPGLEITNMDPRVFELRTYYCNDEKLPNLHTRFREHTMKIFENHGMTNIAYFDFADGQDGADRTLLYFISHSSEEAAKANWQGFLDDPEWQSVYAASIEDGRLVDHLTSVFLKTVDFSPLK